MAAQPWQVSARFLPQGTVRAIGNFVHRSGGHSGRRTCIISGRSLLRGQPGGRAGGPPTTNPATNPATTPTATPTTTPSSLPAFGPLSTCATTMIELHYFPGNASLAPHLLLQELALPFRLHWVDRTQNAHQAPAYLALNPNGQIPVLCDGALVLYESAAICLHLADRVPDAGLLPPLGSAERAQAYKWLLWMSNTWQARLMHYFYPERLVDDGNAAGAAQVKAHAQAHIGTMLDQVEAQLAGHGQPWFLGASFGVTDAYGFMLARWTRGFEGAASPPARCRPATAAWLQRLLDRPAWQRVLADEGLPAPWV